MTARTERRTCKTTRRAVDSARPQTYNVRQMYDMSDKAHQHRFDTSLQNVETRQAFLEASAVFNSRLHSHTTIYARSYNCTRVPHTNSVTAHTPPTRHVTVRRICTLSAPLLYAPFHSLASSVDTYVIDKHPLHTRHFHFRTTQRRPCAPRNTCPVHTALYTLTTYATKF